MNNYPFDKDCPSYSKGGGTTEFWKESYDFEKKQNTMFRNEIQELRSLLLEVGATTHKCKNLHDWYCVNKEGEK